MTPPPGLRAVLFDLDDTLYPEHQFVEGGFRAVARFVARQSGESEEALAARLWVLHERDGRGRLFDTLLAEVGLGDDPDLVPTCVLVYRTHEVHLTPFPGVVAALAELAAGGLRVGLLSDGLASVQRRKLAGLPAVAKRLELVILTDELGPGYAKPSPAPFRVACRLLDVPTAAAAYVANDPAKDFEGARAAGLLTIRVGRPPEHGGPLDSRAAPTDDADIVLAAFDELPATLARAMPGTHAR